MRAVFLAIAAMLLAPCPSRAAELGEVRGLVISTPTSGREWATPAMRSTLRELAGLGANWVAIHPYARISRETGEVRFRADAQQHIRRPVRWAREAGLRVAVKPHLAYWGAFSWRGEIGWPEGDPRWETFRSSYRGWILHLAQISAEEDAGLFVVGTELRRTEGMADWWRGLIHETREVFPGHLTYAANWDDYHRVAFWDELDSIGIQAYFPLSPEPDPSPEQLLEGWRGPLRKMRALSKRHGKPILWTEIGYSSSPQAAARPWESSRRPGPTDLQLRLLRAADAAIEATPEVRGAFLWKWFPHSGPAASREFLLHAPEHKKLLVELWTEPAGNGR